jgi:hypothetical protein
MKSVNKFVMVVNKSVINVSKQVVMNSVHRFVMDLQIYLTFECN